ncbi:MAG: DUF4838 domain-containing protein [Lentisphaerae bacterium]|nr:DUF4838 domain-containing protein [Lentisphaerota bacterium]
MALKQPEYSDPTLRLAQHELHSLWNRCCPDGGPDFRVTFQLVPEQPSFSVTRQGAELLFSAPTTVEILYAVYDFAEKYLGYCFFAPGQDILNASGAGLSLPEGMLIAARKPLLSIRGLVQEFAFNDDTPLLADWMAKNKLNYLNTWMKYYDHLSPERKTMFQIRGIEVQSGHHNFNYWIPGEKYHSTHPEFFAQIDGQRIKPLPDKNGLLLSEQLCTSNPELRREIVRNMLDYVRRYPEVQTLALIPNDGFGWCECPECSRFYDPDRKGDLYSLSTHVYQAERIYLDLLQDVAGQLEKERPDLWLNFCAYINYCRPTPDFRLRENLSVSVAPYWRCIRHRLDDPSCPINRCYASDILAWVKAKDGGKVIIYEYYMGVNFYLSLPMIHHHDVFKEVQWYHQNGVDGLITQFHIPHWSVYGLNYYFMAKAAWDEPEEACIERTLRQLYGAAAPQAKALYTAMKELIDAVGHCHIPYPYSLLKRTTLPQYQQLLQLARELSSAAGSGNTLAAEQVVWCEYLLRFKQLFTAYHCGELTIAGVKEFLAWIHQHRDTRVFVHEKFDLYFQALIDCLQSGRPWLHFNIDWEDDYIRQHERLWQG